MCTHNKCFRGAITAETAECVINSADPDHACYASFDLGLHYLSGLSVPKFSVNTTIS